MNELIWLITFGVLILASLISGIVFLVKYFKTKTKKFLWIGLVLTFIVLGILIYLTYKIVFEPAMIVTCYEPMMVDIPQNMTPAFLLYKKGIIKKIKNRLPKNVVEKISKK